MSALVVEAPGFLTTVQDLGRPGLAACGIPASGAADPMALRIGNRLVGNRDGAAALEMTLVGCSVRFEADACVALTGTEPIWKAFAVRAGEALTCGPIRAGARSYLCVRGGLDVPQVLGSASTHLGSRLGGFEGRRLKSGDRLGIGPPPARPVRSEPVDPRGLPGYGPGPLRIVWGRQASWFATGARARLVDAEWTVSAASDRVGLRLGGPPLAASRTDELVTEGVAPGAIQVPPDGVPILLGVDRPTTGGYPKIAHVIAADLARVGQLRPNGRLRFKPTTIEEAVSVLRQQAHALEALCP